MGGAREKLERLLASHCAPVLFRKKTANLVAAEQELAAYLPEILAGQPDFLDKALQLPEILPPSVL